MPLLVQGCRSTGQDSFRAVFRHKVYMAHQQPRVGDTHSGNITLAGVFLEHSTNNSTMGWCLPNQGTTDSHSLLQQLFQFFLLVDHLGLRFLVQHIPSCQNIVADTLSRPERVPQRKWKLHPDSFQRVHQRFGQATHLPEKDLCLSNPRSTGIGAWHIQHPMGKNKSEHFSAACNPSLGDTKDKSNQKSQAVFSRTLVVGEGLVWRPQKSCRKQPTTPATVVKPTHPPSQQVATPNTR